MIRKELQMRKNIAWGGILILGVLLVVSGCFSSNPKDIKAFKRPYEAELTSNNFILQPPDEVEIRASRIPELDEQTHIIRPDGKISLESVGEVHAAGRTPQELAENIRQKILNLYSLPNDHPVSVKVIANKSKVFYVLGEVYLSGPKPFTGRDTVLRAVAKSRLTPLAWKERIQVIRPAIKPEDRPHIFEVNFDRMVAHGDLKKNVLLEEGDIVYVPPTVLAGVALKIEEFVRPLGRAFSTVNIVEGNATGN